MYLRHLQEKLRNEVTEYFQAIQMSQAPGGFAEIPPTPWIVTLIYDMERHGAMWCDGGLADQPYYLMQDIRMAMGLLTEVRRGARQVNASALPVPPLTN